MNEVRKKNNTKYKTYKIKCIDYKICFIEEQMQLLHKELHNMQEVIAQITLTETFKKI